MGAGPGKIPGAGFIIAGFFIIPLVIALIILMVVFQPRPAKARDDGRYAASPLKSWFDQLKSGRGQCCSDADGTALSDPDWDMEGVSDPGGANPRRHYRVRVDGVWLDVPDDALVTEPNRFGQAMVWPFWLDGRPQIRCFMPGATG